MTEISIIVPIFNVEKYILECLKSIQNQTLCDFEVILIDDGSIDSTPVLIKDFILKDKRFKLFSKKNKGAWSARNEGLKKAKGKYIIFLDSDDTFNPELLEKLYSKITKTNSDISVCSSIKIDENNCITEENNPNFPINSYLTPFNEPFLTADFKDNLFSLVTPVPWNKMLKREFLVENDIKFPPLKIYEDVCFCHLAFALAEKIVVINDKLINYRFNREGSLANKRSSKAIEVVKSCLFLKEELIKRNIFDTLKSAYNSAFINHFQAESAYCSDLDYKNFIKEFKNLLKSDYKNYEKYLKKEKITAEFLKNFIGNKKIMFWGASLFLKNILEKEDLKDIQILGIVDLNESLWGKNLEGYKIYPPKEINTLKPDGVLLSVQSNNKIIYNQLKKDFKEKYPKTELLENMFEKNYEKS